MLNKIKSGIYQWRNIINNKIYIGSSVNVYGRKKVHLHHLKKNKHHSEYLQRSWDKHGEENFIFEIIELVEDKSKLIEREQYYIDTLKPQYNICQIAGSLLGTRRTDECKKRMSENSPHNGIKQSAELIEKRVAPLRNIPRPKSVRDKISLSNKKPKSESHKKNIGIASSKKIGELNPFFNKHHSEKSNKKNSDSQKALSKQTCAHCGKIASPSKIAMWHNDKCLKNPSIDVEKEKERRKPSKELKEKRGNAVSKANERDDVKLKRKQIKDNRPLLTCPYCSKTSYDARNMSQWHGDRCKHNPNISEENIAKAKLNKLKLKEAKAKQEIVTCPHCGKQSRNIGPMNKYHFDNCKTLTGITIKRTSVFVENLKLSHKRRKEAKLNNNS